MTDSQMTGLTLPGMIEEPGCVAGSASSYSPQRGPDPSQRMSLAIFDNEIAIVLSSPEASTTQSRVAWASKWLRASAKLTPVASVSFAATSRPKPAWVLMPVPTAVPPMGKFSASRTLARWARFTQ